MFCPWKNSGHSCMLSYKELSRMRFRMNHSSAIFATHGQSHSLTWQQGRKNMITSESRHKLKKKTLHCRIILKMLFIAQGQNGDESSSSSCSGGWCLTGFQRISGHIVKNMTVSLQEGEYYAKVWTIHSRLLSSADQLSTKTEANSTSWACWLTSFISLI